VNCDFERLELDGTEPGTGTSLVECNVRSIVRLEGSDQNSRYGPVESARELCRAGLEVEVGNAAVAEAESLEADRDDDLLVVERFIRAFLRSTALNENTLRQRLGVKASRFFDVLLPRLVGAGVVRKAPYQGHGAQERMRLAAPMTRIENAMREAGGRFEEFVRAVRSP